MRFKHSLLLLLISLTCTFSLNTLATPSISDYGALPVMDMVAISPNGNLIAYRKTTPTQDVLMIVSISEKKPIVSLDVSKLQPENLYFFNDTQLFFQVSEHTRAVGFRGKFDFSTGFVFDIATKKMRQLIIPGDLISDGQSGLGTIVGMTPDQHYAFMPAWSKTNYQFPDSDYNLYKVDLTKNNIIVATGGDANTYDFFVDHEGKPIVKLVFDEKNNIHKVIAKRDSKWVDIYKKITKIPSKSFVGLSPDFKSLVFLERDEKSDREAYYLMSLTDGSITPTPFSREDADIDGVIHNMQRVVYGVRYSGFTPSYKFFDAVLDQKVKTIVAQFPGQSVFISDFSADWKNIIVKIEGSNYAEDYFLFGAEEKPAFLTTGRPQIKPEDINPIGKITFAARDGLKIPTLVTIPKDKIDAMKNLPAVIFPHGGPTSYDRIEFDYFAQALASEGYLVIQPQFRGSEGFGYSFRNAGFGEWGKKSQDDITDAVKFFSAKGMINPSRVCIVGASYGGYAALAGGAFTPELYKCVVSINGVGDINKMLTYEKNTRGKDSEAVKWWELVIANGEVDEKELQKTSPIYNVKRFTAPVLLIKSTNDKTVSPEQSEDMLDALTTAKKSVQLITLEDDNHYLLKGPTRTKAVEEMVKFVNQNLKQ